MDSVIAHWLPLGLIEALATTPQGGFVVPLLIGLVAT